MKICCFGSLNIDMVFSVEEFVPPGETIRSRATGLSRFSQASKNDKGSAGGRQTLYILFACPDAKSAIIQLDKNIKNPAAEVP